MRGWLKNLTLSSHKLSSLLTVALIVISTQVRHFWNLKSLYKSASPKLPLLLIYSWVKSFTCSKAFKYSRAAKVFSALTFSVCLGSSTLDCLCYINSYFSFFVAAISFSEICSSFLRNPECNNTGISPSVFTFFVLFIAIGSTQ